MTVRVCVCSVVGSVLIWFSLGTVLWYLDRSDNPTCENSPCKDWDEFVILSLLFRLCCGIMVVAWTLIASITSFCFSSNDQKSSETKATESHKLSGTNERSSYGSADDGELRIQMVSQSTNPKPKSKPKLRHSLMGDAQVMENVIDKATIGFLGSAERGWSWVSRSALHSALSAE